MSKKITDFLKDEQGSLAQQQSRAPSNSARLEARLERMNAPHATAAPPVQAPQPSLRAGIAEAARANEAGMRARMDAGAGPQQPLREKILNQPSDSPAMRQRLDALAGPEQPVGDKLRSTPPDTEGLRARLNATAGPQPDLRTRIAAADDGGAGLRERLNATAGPHQPEGDKLRNLPQDNGAIARRQQELQGPQQQTPGERLRGNATDNSALRERLNANAGPQQTPGAKIRGAAMDDQALLRQRLNATAGPQMPPGEALRRYSPDMSAVKERLSALQGPQQPPGQAPRPAAPRPTAAMLEPKAKVRPEPHTVNRPPVQSAPASNPIENPNVASGKGFNTPVMSKEAAAFQNSGGGRALPTQVGGQLPPAAAQPSPIVSKLRSMFGLGERPPAAPGAGAGAAPRAPSAPAAPPSAAGNMARAAFGSGEQWAQTGSKIADAAGRVAGGVGKVAGTTARVVGKVAKPLAAPIGAYETYKGLEAGDNKRAAFGAADTIAGAALWSPLAPVAGTYLGIRGGQELSKMALGERGLDAVGGTVNAAVRAAGKVLGKDWGEDDQNYLNQRAEGDALRAEAAARAKKKQAAPAAKPQPDAAAAGRKGTEAGAKMGAGGQTAPAARAPATSESAIEQAARRSMLADLDAQQAGPDAINKVVRNSDGSANSYYTGSGRQITPPAAATDEDRKLLERVSVVPGQGQRYSTFEQDGKQYMTVEAGRDEVGQPILQGVSVDGAASFPYPNEADSMLSRYMQAKTRADGLQGADREAADAYEAAELRRANIEQQFPQQQAVAAGPAPRASRDTLGGRAAGYTPFHFIGDEQQRRNLQVFAHALAGAEGGTYDKMVGGGTFNSFDAHPRKVGLVTGDGPSTAAGRYQITGTTWDNVAKQSKLADFSPESQDRAMLSLLTQRGAFDDVARGDFAAAVQKLGKEWQGLPSGASKHQGRTTPQQWQAMLDEGQSVYGTQAAQSMAQAQPATLAQAPVEDPLAGAVEVIDGANSRMEVPGASGMRAMDVAAYDAFRDAARRNPELAQRAVITQGGPIVDGITLPPTVLAGGYGSIDSYLRNTRQGKAYEANPAAATLEKQRIETAGEVEKQKIASAAKAMLVDVDSGYKDALGAPIYIKQAMTPDGKVLGQQGPQGQQAKLPPGYTYAGRDKKTGKPVYQDQNGKRFLGE